jgi:hypothetical protein
MTMWHVIGWFCLIMFVLMAWDGISSMPGDK